MALGLGACATKPLAPDPTVDPRGAWTIVAVNGQRTGASPDFNFLIDPPVGNAQFGCNRGGGSLAIDKGWVIAGEWIITVAGCHPRIRMQLERQGFDITAQPMAVERTARGIRLRNRAGSIDLVPAPVAARILGDWTAMAIDGAPLEPRDRFTISITATHFEAQACNVLTGVYRLNGTELFWTGPRRATERGCFDPTGQRDVMATENRAFAILMRPLTVTATPDNLRLQSAMGTIDLVRRR